MAKQVKIEVFSKEFDKLTRQYYQENFEATQEALTTAAKKTAGILSSQSPVRTGRFKSSWKVETKYANTKYVYNDALANNRIPLSNIIEYARNQHPFIYKTFDRYKEDIFRTFVEEYQKEIKRK